MSLDKYIEVRKNGVIYVSEEGSDLVNTWINAFNNGEMPAGIEWWITETNPRVVDWIIERRLNGDLTREEVEVLAAMVAETGDQDWSYRVGRAVAERRINGIEDDVTAEFRRHARSHS